MSAELNEVIAKLGSAFEEFKTEHQTQMRELKSGKADVVLSEKVDRIAEAMTKLEEEKNALERKMQRPSNLVARDESEQKSLDAFNREIKAHAQTQGQPQPADVSIEQMRDYKRTFENVMRKGGQNLADAERKAMIVGSDSDGGYLVPSDTSGRIVSKLFDLSPIRQIASVMTISGDRLEGIEDTDEAASGWVGETGARSDSNTPKIGKYEIFAHEMYAQPKATQKMLDDSSVNVEAWLGNKVADKFARDEGAAFVVGNGVAKPRGFSTYTTAATADSSRTWGQLEHVVTGVNAGFATSNPADTLYDLEAAFKPGYLAGASWVVRRSVLVLIRKFKDGMGNYLLQPSLTAGKPSQLLGYSYLMAEDMPALASESLSMALGDFSVGYQIVDRSGIRVLRDPYTDKPYVKFYTTKRTGGGVVNFEAIKFIKFST